MKLQITISENQLDRIAFRLLRDNPRKRWTLAEKKRLVRELIERKLKEEIPE